MIISCDDSLKRHGAANVEALAAKKACKTDWVDGYVD
jgi:hypothetical protein